MEKSEKQNVLEIAQIQEKCLQMLEEKRILEDCLDRNIGNPAKIYDQISAYLLDIESNLKILDDKNKTLSEKFLKGKGCVFNNGVIFYWEKCEEYINITTITHEQLQS